MSHPELSLPKFVVFASPVYTSHKTWLPIKYKATSFMIDKHLAHAPAGVHGLRNLLDKVRVSSS
eukprot:5856244-Karenia_brevis.AAC.1